MSTSSKSAPSRLRPLRQPSQQRGQQSIEHILAATHRLLRREGAARITTPAIAAEAGLSIGALYHYFPNKEAVILALYESKLAGIRAAVEQPPADSGPARPGDWRQQLRSWVHQVKTREAELGYDLAMNEAMSHFPGLREISRAHLEQQASTITGHLRQLGSDWPQPALYDLALYAMFLNSSLWLYWAHTGHALEHGIERLADTLIALFAPALEGGVPPTIEPRA